MKIKGFTWLSSCAIPHTQLDAEGGRTRLELLSLSPTNLEWLDLLETPGWPLTVTISCYLRSLAVSPSHSRLGLLEGAFPLVSLHLYLPSLSPLPSVGCWVACFLHWDPMLGPRLSLHLPHSWLTLSLPLRLRFFIVLFQLLCFSSCLFLSFFLSASILPRGLSVFCLCLSVSFFLSLPLSYRVGPFWFFSLSICVSLFLSLSIFLIHNYAANLLPLCGEEKALLSTHASFSFGVHFIFTVVL